ncbi:ATP-binding protein [Paraburkholderia sp. CNPSo 3272]|uniref:PAS domain-containing sensor histidine kinase n=1 Tax=Paraburkholderia sp. CNPSo 3272 TaxID=2940931 RepID=UPI0020B83279|nr:PAS domain-containing sensor histidine kinase [Paraburkholderia sp. CNPSo 3272]MCP3727763.1 ATP-binding protein [Paraburkholderia sp. CNPSo 3272]
MTASILAGGGIGLALTTWLCFRFDVGLAVASLVYLTEIVLLSLLESFLSSAVLSLVAVCLLDFFFTLPLFSFQINAVQDVVALAAFVAASFVVTTLVQRAHQLIEVHRKQAQLLDLTHDSVVVRNMDDVITYWNKGAERIYSWSDEEALGKIARSLLRTRFPLPLADIQASLLATDYWEGEVISTRKDGSQVALSTRWALLRNDRGQPIAMLETSTDITENRAKEEALQRVSRLTTMAEFGASFAHELAQPLSAAATNASACMQWLDRDTPNVEKALAGLRRVMCETERLSELFQRVRMLAKGTAPQMTPLEIGQVVDDVIALLQRDLLNHRIALTRKLSPDLPVVLGDRIQLAQVITNLLMNGIQAMDSIEDRPRELSIESQCSDEAGVIVAVQDSGDGIDPGVIARIFEPFYTTKPEGMGIGLAICRSIVRAHGGQLRAMNRAGHGARFEISLPAVTAAEAKK